MSRHTYNNEDLIQVIGLASNSKHSNKQSYDYAIRPSLQHGANSNTRDSTIGTLPGTDTTTPTALGLRSYNSNTHTNVSMYSPGGSSGSITGVISNSPKHLKLSQHIHSHSQYSTQSIHSTQHSRYSLSQGSVNYSLKYDSTDRDNINTSSRIPIMLSLDKTKFLTFKPESRGVTPSVAFEISTIISVLLIGAIVGAVLKSVLILIGSFVVLLIYLIGLLLFYFVFVCNSVNTFYYYAISKDNGAYLSYDESFCCTIKYKQKGSLFIPLNIDKLYSNDKKYRYFNDVIECIVEREIGKPMYNGCFANMCPKFCCLYCCYNKNNQCIFNKWLNSNVRIYFVTIINKEHKKNYIDLVVKKRENSINKQFVQSPRLKMELEKQLQLQRNKNQNKNKNGNDDNKDQNDNKTDTKENDLTTKSYVLCFFINCIPLIAQYL